MTQNMFLETLPNEICKVLAPHLQHLEVPVGTLIALPHEPVDRVYFPQSGLISCSASLDNGSHLQTAMIGIDGVVNAAAAINDCISMSAATVHIPSVASIIDAKRFAAIAHDIPALLSAVISYEHRLLAQTQQVAACNAMHPAAARVASWLLRAREITKRDRLCITQELLGDLLGIRRTSVTVIARGLKDDGLIRYSRGRIDIIDSEALHRRACECCRTVQRIRSVRSPEWAHHHA